MPDNSIQPLQPIPTLQNQQGSLSPAAIEALRKFASGLYSDKYKPPSSKWPFYTWANGLSDAGGDILGAMTYNRANELERQQGVRSGRAALGLPDDDSAVQPAPFNGMFGPLGKPIQNLFGGGGNATASADKPVPPTPQAPTPSGSAFTENGTIDPVHARVVAQLESGGDPNAQTGSYKGTYQFRNGQYGITDKNWQDPGAQAAAFALEQKDLKTMLEARGIDPTPQNLYMAHLHGAGGLIAHTQNPDQPAWLSMAQTKEGRDHGKQAEAWARQAVTGNPFAPNMDPDVSSGDYLKGWGDKYNRTYARFSPDSNVRTGVIPPGGAPRPPAAVPAVASSTPAVRPPGVPPTLPPGGTTPPRIPYTDPADLAANRGDTAEQPNLFMDLSKLPIPRPRPTSGAPLQYAGGPLPYEKPSFRNDLGLPPPEPPPPAPGTPTDIINKRFGPWQTDPRTGTTTPSPSMDDFNLDAKGNVRPVPLPQPRPNIPVAPPAQRMPFAPEGPTGNVQTAQAVPPPGPQNAPVSPTGAGQGTTKAPEQNWFQQQTGNFIDTSKLPGRPRYDWNAIANNWLRYSPQEQAQFIQLHNAEQQPLSFDLPGGGKILYHPENPRAGQLYVPSIQHEAITLPGGLSMQRTFVIGPDGVKRYANTEGPGGNATPQRADARPITQAQNEPDEQFKFRQAQDTFRKAPNLAPSLQDVMADPMGAGSRYKNYIESDKDYREKASRLHDLGQNSSIAYNQGQLLEKVLQDPRFVSGWKSGVIKDWGQAAYQLGLSKGETATLMSIGEKLGSGQMVNDIREIGSSGQGVVRSTEAGAIEKSQFSLDKNTPEANLAIVRNHQKMMKRAMEIPQLADAYAETHNNRLDQGFDSKLSQYYRDKPLYNDEEIKAFTDTATKPAASSAATPPVKPNQAAIDYLRAHPDTRKHFEKTFPGSNPDDYLGK